MTYPLFYPNTKHIKAITMKELKPIPTKVADTLITTYYDVQRNEFVDMNDPDTDPVSDITIDLMKVTTMMDTDKHMSMVVQPDCMSTFQEHLTPTGALRTGLSVVLYHDGCMDGMMAKNAYHQAHIWQCSVDNHKLHGPELADLDNPLTPHSLGMANYFVKPLCDKSIETFKKDWPVLTCTPEMVNYVRGDNNNTYVLYAPVSYAIKGRQLEKYVKYLMHMLVRMSGTSDHYDVAIQKESTLLSFIDFAPEPLHTSDPRYFFEDIENVLILDHHHGQVKMWDDYFKANKQSPISNSTNAFFSQGLSGAALTLEYLTYYMRDNLEQFRTDLDTMYPEFDKYQSVQQMVVESTGVRAYCQCGINHLNPELNGVPFSSPNSLIDLVSDHDTYRHQFPRPFDLIKGLYLIRDKVNSLIELPLLSEHIKDLTYGFQCLNRDDNIRAIGDMCTRVREDIVSSIMNTSHIINELPLAKSDVEAKRLLNYSSRVGNVVKFMIASMVYKIDAYEPRKLTAHGLFYESEAIDAIGFSNVYNTLCNQGIIRDQILKLSIVNCPVALCPTAIYHGIKGHDDLNCGFSYCQMTNKDGVFNKWSIRNDDEMLSKSGEKFQVNQIAELIGGSGHPGAAGFETPVYINSAESLIHWMIACEIAKRSQTIFDHPKFNDEPRSYRQQISIKLIPARVYRKLYAHWEEQMALHNAIR